MASAVGQDGAPTPPPHDGSAWVPDREARDRLALAPAGVFRRALALVADAGVVIALGKLGAALAVPMRRHDLVARAFLGAWLLVVPAAYVVLAHGTGGRTLGKLLLGARVVARRGAPLGYPRALARLLALALSVVPLGGGFLLAALRRDRRALHDLVAGTRVVRTR